MLSHPILRRCFVWPAFLLTVFSPCLAPRLQAQTNPPQRTITNFLAVVQGTVEIAPAPGRSWRPARLNDPVRAGDRLRTAERSRAEVFLAEGMTIKLGPSSELEVPPSPRVTMPRGIFQIFNRQPSRGNQFRLPGGIAAIRGTDFLVEVSESGPAIVTVLDGEVALSNEQGEVAVQTGEEGILAPGQKPVVAKIDLASPRLIQWSLYYPAVLALEDLQFTSAESAELGPSIGAYRRGNLPEAFRLYPWSRTGISPAEQSYRAGLLLLVGRIDEAFSLLTSVSPDSPPRRALAALVSAVRLENISPNTPSSASEWIANSYYEQVRFNLEAARSATRAALRLAPGFGFAWIRLAELEFGFGTRHESRRALDEGLRLSPEHAHGIALQGFVFASENRIREARAAFDRAIALDPAYPNAWLGRGLTSFRQGDDRLAQADLLVAASLDPQRALYRSYLGKAFQEVGDDLHARRELELSKRADPKDPTAWLYSALLNAQENRINEAVRDLERSAALNENRSLFRSRLLLDEDRAVRGANLAALYRDAGLEDFSLREASRAVQSDYANFSAHLFLANSYNALRDPGLFNLRYETATFSEYLLANLLSPVGGTPLSQQVSQQEYSRLFDRNRSGLSSETVYLSNGQWQQAAAQYGVFPGSAYALEGAYRKIKGAAPNTTLDQRTLSLQLKQELTPEDSLYLQTVYNWTRFGDLAQYLDPSSASPTLRNQETQEPNLFLGWHHQWSPGSHTLLLLARLHDDFQLEQPLGRIDALLLNSEQRPTNTFARACAEAGLGGCDVFDLDYRSAFEIYSAEFQQIWRTPRHAVVGGARFQTGTAETVSRSSFLGPPLAAIYFESPEQTGRVTSDLQRTSAYLSYQWSPLEVLSLIAGFTFDHLRYPENISSPPVTEAEQSRTDLSPKAGLVWTPHPSSTVRAAYTRSVGGLFYEGSVRLEPTQIAGFNQAYRSLAPPSLVGSLSGTEFETVDLASEHRLPSAIYLGWQAEVLQSRSDRVAGIYAGPPEFAGLRPGSVEQRITYRERSLSAYLNQLIGNAWSWGAKYRLTESELNIHSRGVSRAAWPEGQSEPEALLHQLKCFAIYNHPSGLFGTLQGLWTMQHQQGRQPRLPGEDFWQWNLLAGYRFPRRQAEITLGVLNLADEDYRLSPVSLYAELPRQRTLFASLRFNF